MKIKKKRFTKKIKLLIMLVLTVVLTVPLFTNVVYAEEQNKTFIPFHIYIDDGELYGNHTLTENDFDFIRNQRGITFVITNNLSGSEFNVSEFRFLSISSNAITVEFRYTAPSKPIDYLLIQRDGVSYFDEYTYNSIIDLNVAIVFDYQIPPNEIETDYIKTVSAKYKAEYAWVNSPPVTFNRTIDLNLDILNDIMLSNDKLSIEFNKIANHYVSSSIQSLYINADYSNLVMGVGYNYGAVNIYNIANINSSPFYQGVLYYNLYNGNPNSFNYYNDVLDLDPLLLEDIITIDYSVGYYITINKSTGTSLTNFYEQYIFTDMYGLKTFKDLRSDLNAIGIFDYKDDVRITYLTNTMYQAGVNDGKQQGFSDGRGQGLTEGYNEARGQFGILYQGNWISASQYGDIRYQAGLQDSDYDDIWNEAYRAGADDSFYSGMQKWLVPAIIVVLFGGGFLYFASRRRE